MNLESLLILRHRPRRKNNSYNNSYNNPCMFKIHSSIYPTTVESLQIAIPQRHCERKRSNLGNNL